MADNLSLPAVASNQNSKELTINTAFTQLSGALADGLSCDLSAANYTLSSANFKSYINFITSGNTVARTFTVPAVKRAAFLIQNGGTASLSIVRGTTTLTLTAGNAAFYVTDGTANGLSQLPLKAGAATFIELTDTPSAFTGASRKYLRVNAAANAVEFIDASYTPAVYVPSTPTNSQLCLKFMAVVPFTLPASLTGSKANATTAATGAVSFTIYKNGASQGTINFAASGTNATFTFASDVSFAAGDILEIVAPATADATLADIAISLKGYLT